MLQLINGGNVAVSQPASDDEPLQLQLLSLERHHEQMFCFKAPSLHEKVRAWQTGLARLMRTTSAPKCRLCVCRVLQRCPMRMTALLSWRRQTGTRMLSGQLQSRQQSAARPACDDTLYMSSLPWSDVLSFPLSSQAYPLSICHWLHI